MTVETVAYSRYEVRSVSPSALGLTEDVDKVVAFECPRCSTHNTPLEHGGTTHCSSCGLYFQKFGNGLHCSDSSFSE